MRSQPAVETSSYCRVMPVAGGRTIVSSESARKQKPNKQPSQPFCSHLFPEQ